MPKKSLPPSKPKKNFEFSLRFRGGEFSPDDITKLFGVPNPSRFKHPMHKPSWVKTISRGVDDLEEEFNRCADSLMNHKQLFNELRQKGVFVSFFIGIYVETHFGFTLSPLLQNQLALLGINLEFDIYEGGSGSRYIENQEESD